MKEHMDQMSVLGQWLSGQRANGGISISIYEPEECMIAIEQQYGCGYNPENIGLEWAEKALIAMLNPMLNISRPSPMK
jgi:hypothetical protein